MQFDFLGARIPLTKTVTRDPVTKEIDKGRYPNVKALTSYRESAKDLKEFAQLLRDHAAKGHCMLHGLLDGPLVSESRQHKVDKYAPVDWLCLDMDKVSKDCTPDAVMQALDLADVSYILQWSASHGFNPNELRYHLFMQLTSPVVPGMIRQWMQHKNLTVTMLTANMKLTKAKTALTWPMDLVMSQNARIIFIAPPILTKGVVDPLKGTPRISYHERAKATFALPTEIQGVGNLKERIKDKINALREGEGLPPHKQLMRSVRVSGESAYIMTHPEATVVTSVIDEEDSPFVRINLGGGDSNAYWYLRDNPEILRNFKDEPDYLLREVAPDYYASLRNALNDRKLETRETGILSETAERTWLVVRQEKRSTYHHGWYDAKDDLLHLAPARNKEQVREFCVLNNLPYPDAVPIWDFVFDPPSTAPRLDVKNKKLNLFQTTVYMRSVATRPVKTMPKTIERVLKHLFPASKERGWECLERFVNWLAFVVQNRTTPHTAWLLYGTQGTGKGVLANHILTPLFGEQQVNIMNGTVLNDKWNDYAFGKMLLIYDEVDFPKAQHPEMIAANLRTLITEKTFPMRAMGVSYEATPNHAAMICLSNQQDALRIERNDRRWNVAPYQTASVKYTEAEMLAIESELQMFYDYLAHYKVNALAAQTPYDSPDRDMLMTNTARDDEEVMRHIIGAYGTKDGGDMDWFLDYMPNEQEANGNMNAKAYRVTVENILKRKLDEDGLCRIHRDEIHAILVQTCGERRFMTKHSVSQWLHNKMHIETYKATVDGVQYNTVMKTTWKDAAKFQDYLQKHFHADPVVAKPPNNVHLLKGKK